MGFTFDDTDKDGIASPIAEMHRLIAKDKRNAERIFPYIGGEEVNDSPIHSHRRYVINFGEMTEEEARCWPDLMAIVEEKVKPQRMNDNREVRRQYWWRFGETTPALFAAIRGRARVLINALYGPYLSMTFLPGTMVFNNKLNVMPFTEYPPFCTLQSRVHEVWARAFSSTLKDDLAYAPSDCFETFPFPDELPDVAASFQLAGPTGQVGNLPPHHALEAAGKEYYEFRAALMVRNNEGLTKTYNRFHDPNERSSDIVRLRELHAAMDRAVLDAYGWTDLQPTCAFLLDYEEDEDEEETSGRQRKKPWRYRWPDDFRDEVLARLLALNKERAQQESLSGAPAAKKPKGGKGGRKKAPRQPPEAPGLF
jgi:hypothetical protein